MGPALFVLLAIVVYVVYVVLELDRRVAELESARDSGSEPSDG